MLSAEVIRGLREMVGHTQVEAAQLVHVTARAWQMWEHGDRQMPAGLWELYVIKAGLHPTYKPSSKDVTR